MKFKLIALAAVLFAGMALCASAFAGKPKEQKKELKFQYDIEYIKTAGDGISSIKIFSYGGNKREAQDRCVANAVHGVIFKGYAGQGAYQGPLVKSVNGYNDNYDFFNNFFKNGDYGRYASGIVDGTQQLIKIKGGYKCAAVVNVNVKMLRKHLEEAGIIKGLASGF